MVFRWTWWKKTLDTFPDLFFALHLGDIESCAPLPKTVLYGKRLRCPCRRPRSGRRDQNRFRMNSNNFIILRAWKRFESFVTVKRVSDLLVCFPLCFLTHPQRYRDSWASLDSKVSPTRVHSWNPTFLLLFSTGRTRVEMTVAPRSASHTVVNEKTVLGIEPRATGLARW